MPHYMPPDYLDNTEQHNMAAALARIIGEWEQRELDIATGYFEPAVWQQIADGFSMLSRLRLLLGKEPEIEGALPAGIDLRQYYQRKLRGDLEAMPFDQKYAALIDSLLAFLRRSGVEVRVYPNFLHAKAYIFNDLAIVGSSNLTPSGLNRRAELNLVRKEETVARSLRHEWFESFWAEAEDYKADLIQALEASKFGAAEHTAFDVFIKALYEYFKERLAPDAAQIETGINLASFQEEGLREAIRLLERHHGVIIADAVGLGKTFIGLRLLEHYLLKKRRRGYVPRGLIVCPAQLRDLVWRPKLDEYGLKATICSMEEFGRQDFDWKRYNANDFVLVDESHNFRNPGTGRYQNLNKLICTGKADKHVVLMTATPINNTVWDLYHQIMLITRGSEAYYREIGISNLKGFFKRVAEGSAELFDLLEESAVRRSRYDIKQRQEHGEKVILPGKGEIHFPERELRSIDYNLEQTYTGLYDEIAEQIEHLTLVSYNIEQWWREGDEHAVQRNEALIGIIKTTFLKRLESSLRAFEVSIERMEAFQKRFFEILKQGRLLDAANHRKLLALEDEADSQESIDQLLEELPDVPIEDYDLTAIQKRLEMDLAILDDLLDWIRIIRETAGGTEGNDAKLAAVKAELAAPLRGQKVLVFTYYQDTANYLFNSLCGDAEWKAKAGQPSIGLITGRTGPDEREHLVKCFAPMANTPDTDEGQRERRELLTAELQILISTDVLSEGQNLQDAGVLINYDLHWNPVRMIQRAGRIDRLGTPFEKLTIYNCFPEEGLEHLLRLVERLQGRIADIDRTLGLDASVLGEIIHPKSLDDLKRIKAGERKVLDDLEQMAELVSTDEMKLPLLAYLQSLGEQRVQEIPLGIHSGKQAGMAGTFFAFKARDYHFWRFYPADGSPVITEKRRIFNMIRCGRDEPRLVPDHTIFSLLERATQDIVDELKALRTARKIRPQMVGINRQLYDALNQGTLFEDVPAELRQRVSQVLMNVPLRLFQRDPVFKAMVACYKGSGSILTWAEQLDAFFVDNELYRDVIEPTVLEKITAEDLRLVCYEVLTAAS